MKKEYAQRSGQENWLEWIQRLHELVLNNSPMENVDLDLITILINNIPTLVKMAGEKR